MAIRRASYFLVIGVLLLAPDSTRAADLTWDTASGLPFFDDSANWDPQQSPTSADDLLFDIDTAGTPIIIGATSEFSDMRFSDFDWTLTGGAGGTLTSTSGSIRIDDVLATDLAGGTNVAMSSGLVLDTTGDFYVGQTGFGGLTIESGSESRVRSVFIGEGTGSTGQVTVTGVGTTLTTDGLSVADGYNIGLAGTGTLNVMAGGVARHIDTTSGIADLRVGQLAGSNGTLNIDGAGSQFVAEDSFIGNSGSATVNITNGGRLLQTIQASPDAFVGVQANGIGNLTINGDGSQWQARRIEIGGLGDATLSVEAGGIVSSTGDNMVLGTFAGATGRVAVFGSEASNRSSVEVAQSLFVGNIGQGELVVGRDLGGVFDGAGLLFVGTDLVVGSSSANTLDNRVVIDGADAAATVLGNVIVGGAGRGTLSLLGDGSLNAANLLIGQADGNTNDNVVTMSGAGSVIDVTEGVNVGVSGRGNLAIAGATLTAGGPIDIGAATNGDGTFSASGATITTAGAFQVATGVNSTGVAVLDNGTNLTALELFLGNSGGTNTSPAVGAMTVRGGSTVTLTRADDIVAVTLGDDPGTTGTLTVTGAGSSVGVTGGTAEWWVGGSSNDDGGTGTLNVFDGATATSGGRIVVGYDTTGANIARGFVNVDGTGSTLNAGNDLMIVGFQGSGEVDITDGGRLNANAMFIADASGSAGSDLTIDGAGSTFNLQERLHVGDSARGSMTLSGGAIVNVAQDPNASPVNQRLIVGVEGGADGSRLTLTGTGTRLEYFGDNDGVRVGFFGGSTSNRAVLEVLNGAVLNTVQRNPDQSISSQGFLIVGDENGGNGQVVVSGDGSRINAKDLRLGNALGTNNSSGVVTINNGGAIEVTGLAEIADNGQGTSTMTVTGTGSRFDVGSTLAVGSGQSATSTTGSLTIADGAVVTNGTRAYVGRFSASVGTVTVGGTGENAVWDVGAELIIAGDRTDFIDAGSQTSGSGTLNVSAGGVVNVSDQLFLKDRGVINLDGGELATDDIVFQDLASRTLSPTFNFHSGTLRYTADKNFSSDNSATVFAGQPAVLDAGKHLAFEGVAVLDAPIRTDGGTLSIGSITAINFQDRVDFDAGTLNLTDAGVIVTAAGLLGDVAVIDNDQTINVTNSVFVEGDGLLSIVGGTLTMGGGAVNAGGTLVVAGGVIDFGGGLTNNGDVILIDAVADGTLTNNADLTLVNTVLGGGLAANAGGTISFDVGVAGDTDLLDLSGAASLAGTLDVELDDSAGLTVGDEIDLLLADTGVTGTFDTELLPMLGGGLALDVLYEANRVALIVILAGDYNGDGAVNAADYTVWRDGSSPDSSQAGYDLWAANFGATAASAASNAVPEPSAALAMAAVCIGAGLVRRLR